MSHSQSHLKSTWKVLWWREDTDFESPDGKWLTISWQRPLSYRNQSIDLLRMKGLNDLVKEIIAVTNILILDSRKENIAVHCNCFCFSFSSYELQVYITRWSSMLFACCLFPEENEWIREGSWIQMIDELLKSLSRRIWIQR